MLQFPLRDRLRTLRDHHKRQRARRRFFRQPAVESLEQRQLLAFDVPVPLSDGVMPGEPAMMPREVSDRLGFDSELDQGEGEGEPQISVTNATVTEGQTAVFTVTLSEASTEALAVDFYTADGSAQGGSEAGSGYDYQTNYSSVYFAAGETSKMIGIPTFSDMESESDETFTVQLSTWWGASATGTGTIQNDPSSTPTVSATGEIVMEGQTAVFTVSLAQASSLPISVSYSTSSDSAYGGWPGDSSADFYHTSGTLDFAAGETEKTFSVDTLQDLAIESDEQFTVEFWTPWGTSTTASATIQNDPATTPDVSATDALVTEGQTAVFVVHLAHASSLPIAISYATSGNTATGGWPGDGSVDFYHSSGTLEFAAGDTEENIPVQTLLDFDAEADEQFSVELSTPWGSMITATGTIQNYTPPPPSLSFTSLSLEVAEGAEVATVTVTLSSASAESVTVQYSTSDATAAAGADYTDGSVGDADLHRRRDQQDDHGADSGGHGRRSE
jgi:hypothetical protein